MRVPALAAFGVIAVLTACAPMSDATGPAAEGGASARQCFNVSQVNNFRQGRHNQIFLRVGRGDVYEMNSMGGCSDLDFANRLTVTPDIGGAAGTRLCTGDSARIFVPGSNLPPSACRARVTRKLTDEEVAALPANQRP